MYLSNHEEQYYIDEMDARFEMDSDLDMRTANYSLCLWLRELKYLPIDSYSILDQQ